MLDYHNATHWKTVLGPENIPDVTLWVSHNDAELLCNWYNIIVIHAFVIMMRDFYRTDTIFCMMITPKMHCRRLWTGYHIRPTHNVKIPDMISWVSHNDAELSWNWYHPFAWQQSSCNILINYLQAIWFSVTRKLRLSDVMSQVRSIFEINSNALIS